MSAMVGYTLPCIPSVPTVQSDSVTPDSVPTPIRASFCVADSLRIHTPTTTILSENPSVSHPPRRPRHPHPSSSAFRRPSLTAMLPPSSPPSASVTPPPSGGTVSSGTRTTRTPWLDCKKPVSKRQVIKKNYLPLAYTLRTPTPAVPASRRVPHHYLRLLRPVPSLLRLPSPLRLLRLPPFLLRSLLLTTSSLLLLQLSNLSLSSASYSSRIRRSRSARAASSWALRSVNEGMMRLVVVVVGYDGGS